MGPVCGFSQTLGGVAVSDVLFLGSDELRTIVGYLAEFVGAGVGLGFMFWALGSGFWLLLEFVRGL